MLRNPFAYWDLDLLRLCGRGLGGVLPSKWSSCNHPSCPIQQATQTGHGSHPSNSLGLGMVVVIARRKAVVLLIYSSVPACQSFVKNYPHHCVIDGSIHLPCSVTVCRSLVVCMIWRGAASGRLGTKGLSLSRTMVCVVIPMQLSSLTCNAAHRVFRSLTTGNPEIRRILHYYRLTKTWNNKRL